MSRTETTAMLSELVEKRLKNRVSFWASEVNFDLGTSKNRRIDFMGFKPFTPGYVLMPASVELGEFSCYEVKSCMADFKSGHGLTFYGGRELPRDHKGTGRGTASQLPAATQYQSSAHTIEKGDKLVPLFDVSGKCPSYRCRAASEMLYAMIEANGKRTN